MGLFGRKVEPESDDIASIEAEIAAFDDRHEALTQRGTTTDADLEKERRARLEILIGPAADEESVTAADRRIAALESSASGTRLAIDEVGRLGDDARRRLRGAQDAMARKAEGDRLKAVVAAIDEAREKFTRAARVLADALAGSRVQMADAVAAALATGAVQIAGSAAEIANTCRVNESALRAGGGRILAAPPVPITEAPASAVVIPRKRVYAADHLCWSENGAKRTGARYLDHDLPLGAAERAIRAGAAELIDSPRAARLRAAFSGARGWNPPVRDCIDVDALPDAVDTTAVATEAAE